MSLTTTAPITRATERWVLFAAITASAMAFIDSSALNVALPALQTDLGVSGTELLWIINSYALMLSTLILVGGSMGDLYGRKRVFMIGIGIFAVASLLCGLAPNAGMLIAARTLKGVGGALMIPGSLALIAALFPDSRRGVAIGTWSTLATLATLGGPVLGGWLAEQGLWRVIFYLNLPLAGLALLVLWRFVPESQRQTDDHRLDIPGALTAILGLGGLSFGFIQGAEWGYDNAAVIAALVIGVVGLIAFVQIERTSDHPMMPLDLFRSTTFAGTNLLTFFLYAALGGLLFFLPLNLVQVQGYRQDEAGFASLPFIILLALISRSAGALADRVGPRSLLIVGPALTGVGFAALAFIGQTNGAQDYWTTFFIATVLQGVGMGLTVAPLTAAVMGSAPRTASGIASGINNAVSRTAGVLAVAVMGAIALIVFSGALTARIAETSLTPEAQSTLTAAASQLAAVPIPDGLDAAQTAEADAAIRAAFLDSFALIAWIAAGLAWISAVMTIVFVRRVPMPAPVPAA